MYKKEKEIFTCKKKTAAALNIQLIKVEVLNIQDQNGHNLKKSLFETRQNNIIKRTKSFLDFTKKIE